jgi:hypothetical protein
MLSSSQRLDPIIRNGRMIRTEPLHSLELRDRILLSLGNMGQGSPQEKVRLCIVRSDQQSFVILDEGISKPPRSLNWAK